MIRAVDILHSARAAARFDGVDARARITDWAALVRQKQALVDDLRAAKYSDVLPNYDTVPYIEGAARFQADSSVVVAGQVIKAEDKVVIDTGSRPQVPYIAGLEGLDWLDSTSALEMDTLPHSMMIMGGGFIGVELAQVFARAGTQVTIVTRRGLLPESEPEISAALTRYFAAEGIKVRYGLDYDHFEHDNDQVTLHAGHKGEPLTISAARLLLATGRRPNSDKLALNVAGIKTDAGGGIVTDDQLQTSRAGVFAAGDVTGRDQFVYMTAYNERIQSSF